MASTMVRLAAGGPRWVLGLAVFALTLVGTTPAAAQVEEQQISVDPRAGVTFPMRDLALTNEPGVTAGLGVAFKVHPTIGFRGDFDISVLDDESPVFGQVLTPTMTLLHYNAGVELDFPPPDWQNFPLTFRWNIGAGATSMSASRDFPEGEDIDFSGTYPSVNSGVKIGYRVAPSIDVFAGGRMFVIFVDDTDTRELLKRTDLEPFGTAWSAPVTLGVKASFQ